MSAARSAFYNTLDDIRELTPHSLLRDVLPLNDPRNNRARILRSGLVVSAFSHLEAYIEQRLEEIPSQIERFAGGLRELQ